MTGPAIVLASTAYAAVCRGERAHDDRPPEGVALKNERGILPFDDLQSFANALRAAFNPVLADVGVGRYVHLHVLAGGYRSLPGGSWQMAAAAAVLLKWLTEERAVRPPLDATLVESDHVRRDRDLFDEFFLPFLLLPLGEIEAGRFLWRTDDYLTKFPHVRDLLGTEHRRRVWVLAPAAHLETARSEALEGHDVSYFAVDDLPQLANVLVRALAVTMGVPEPATPLFGSGPGVRLTERAKLRQLFEPRPEPARVEPARGGIAEPVLPTPRPAATNWPLVAVVVLVASAAALSWAF